MLRTTLLILVLCVCTHAQYPPGPLPSSVFSVLRTFYHATNGDQWISNYGWVEGLAQETDPCCSPTGPTSCSSWYGIYCDFVTTNTSSSTAADDAAVSTTNSSNFYWVGLNFYGVRVSGILPSALCELSLASLVFVDNPITGTIPSCFFDGKSNLSRSLTSLALSQLSLSPTPLPESLPPNVEYLSLSGLNMGGSIPESYQTRLSGMGFLDLSANNLTGEIPAWLTTTPAPYLSYLSLCQNRLSGPFSFVFDNMPSLSVLDLSQNELSGALPDVFGSVCLASLDLSFNNFSGHLPPSFGTMLKECSTNITLSYNEFSGPLDPLFPPQSKIASLVVSDNNFSGPLPPFFFSAQNMSIFIASNNHMGPELPKSLSLLSSLTTFDVARNNFSVVEKGFAAFLLPSLSFFSMAGNQLTEPPPLMFQQIALENNLPRCTWTTTISFLDLSNNPFDPLLLEEFFQRLIESPSGATAFQSCVFWESSSNTILQSLILDNVNVYGALSPNIFLLFPRLVQLSLQGNALQGRLPSSVYLRGGYLPYSLSSLTLDDNVGLTGDIPTLYGVALESNLRSLSLRNTHVTLQSPEFELPSYLVPDWERVQDTYNTYSCPAIVSTTTRSVLYVDPSFYNNTLCQCSLEYFGTVTATGTGCAPVLSYCHDGQKCAKRTVYMNSKASSISLYLVPKPGFYPFPSPERATVFAKCSDLPSTTSSLACNPTGSLVCTSLGRSDPHAMSCLPEQYACREGHTGRACSQCLPGHYHSFYGCVKCKETEQSGVWYALSALAFVVFAILLLELRTASGSVRLSKIRDIYHKNRTLRGFWVAYGKDVAMMVGVFVSFAVMIVPFSLQLVSVVVFAVVIVFFVAYSFIRKSLPVDLGAKLAETRSLAEHRQDGGGDFHESLGDNGTERVERNNVIIGGFLGTASVQDVKSALSALQGLGKSVLIFIQTLAQLTVFVVSYPPQMAFILSTTQFVTDACVLSCRNNSWSYTLAFVVVILGPLVLSGVAFVLFAVWTLLRKFERARTMAEARGKVDAVLRAMSARARERTQVRHGYRSLISALILLGYILYFPLVSAYLTLFVCREDPSEESDKSFMVYAPYIECYARGGRHVFMIAVGSCAMFAYSCILLTVFTLITYQARKNRLGVESNMVKFSILYASFDPQMWWYEIPLTMRRLGLAVVVSAMSPTSVYTAAVVTFILVLSLGHVAWYRPFSTRLGNFVEALSVGSLIFVFILSQSSLRLYQASDSVVLATTGEPNVLNIIALCIVSITIYLYAITTVLIYLPLIPFFQNRSFTSSLFSWLGVGTRSRPPPSSLVFARDSRAETTESLDSATPARLFDLVSAPGAIISSTSIRQSHDDDEDQDLVAATNLALQERVSHLLSVVRQQEILIAELVDDDDDPLNVG